MPDALISSTTSPGPGSGSGNSMNSRVRSPAKTTARMRLLPLDLSLGSKSGTVRRDFKSREWPAPMRITAIHDIVVPIASSISNAYIDFSAMTASVVAVVTDIRCDGRPVVGFGFNSNGRYASQGEMRGYLDLGYTTVKMKVGGADLATDLRRIEAVLAVVGSGERLCVDVNGRVARHPRDHR